MFGFNFADKVNYEGISELNWNSKGVGSEFILIPGGSPVLIQGNFAWSSYNTILKEFESNGTIRERSSEINGYNMGMNFTYFQPKGKVKYGFDVHGFQTDYTTYNSVNSKVGIPVNTSDFSAYLNYQFNSTRWIVEPGFRLQYYGNIGASPEPRLGMKYIASERMRFKLSAGMYSQNLQSTISDRDVVNLFTGIISTDVDYLDGDYDQKLQKAQHLITGIEFDISNKIDFQLEGYVKDFYQLININRNMTSDDDPQFIVESGIAKGVDALVKYKGKKLYIWAVYSLGLITRNDEEREYSEIAGADNKEDLVSLDINNSS